MGADDQNEGTALDECPRHEWAPNLAGWAVVERRLIREYVCRHCGTVTVMSRGEYR